MYGGNVAPAYLSPPRNRLADIFGLLAAPAKAIWGITENSPLRQSARDRAAQLKWQQGMADALARQGNPSAAVYQAPVNTAKERGEADLTESALGFLGPLRFRSFMMPMRATREMTKGYVRPADFMEDALKARGINARRVEAGTGSQYLTIPDSPFGYLKLRFSDHSRYAPTGSTSRAHTLDQWEFGMGMDAENRRRLISALRTIDDAIAPMFGQRP